jgi:hypothetical protein
MIQCKDVIEFSVDSSANLAEVYRRFTKTLSSFSDLNMFAQSLDAALQADPHLASRLLLVDERDDGGANEVFEKGHVVVPLRGDTPNGYVQVSQHRDARPFGPGDLQLMGAIAGFVSSLYSQAKVQQKLAHKANILQFLIDQLPLGIVCFDSSGELISGNVMAWSQLNLKEAPAPGAAGPVLKALLAGVGIQGEAHIEIDGRLMFVARRDFEPAGEDRVTAYVIYDLSKRRGRLIDALDREYYKARCLDAGVTVALLQSNMHPGALYGFMKQSAAEINLDKDLVQPLDAYLCACVFPDRCMVSVRALLGELLHSSAFEGDLRVSLVTAEDASPGSPAGDTIQAATEALQPVAAVLLPQLLVFDLYRPIFETLELMLDGIVGLTYCDSCETVLELMQARHYDGIILEVDSLDSEESTAVRALADDLKGSFKVFYSSYKQPQMARAEYGLPTGACLLQKPFDAAAVVDAVSLQFNLA